MTGVFVRLAAVIANAAATTEYAVPPVSETGLQ